MRRYSLKKDIDSLKLELARIHQLRNTLKTEGWTEVLKVFHQMITKYHDDIMGMCDNPSRNEMEIRCKKMLVDALGAILLTLDSRISSEEFVRKNLLERAEHIDVQKDIAKYQTL